MATTVTVGFGKMSLATSGLTLTVFDLSPPNIRKLLSKAHKGSKIIPYPVSPNPEINGSLYMQTVDVPEGAIIQVQSSRTYRGASFSDGTLFARVRATAALHTVFAKLPAGSLLGSRFQSLSGNFDFLHVDELPAMGIELHPNVLRKYMNAEEIDELFEISTLSPEVSARPVQITVEHVDGSTSTVFVAPLPKRRIRVSR